MTRVIKETNVIDTSDVEQPVRPSVNESPNNVAARMAYLIGGTLIVLLVFRFILSLIGANKTNMVADFVYSVTYPFVVPFFGIFRYQVQYGVSRFEVETLVAIGVYTFLTWLIVNLLTIKSETE